MTDFAPFIAEILALNGGCLRGKLEANNLGYGFDFGIIITDHIARMSPSQSMMRA